MLLQSCLHCEFHELKEDNGKNVSYCRKENCWSRYSKCVAMRALDRFLSIETADRSKRSSILDRVYSRE
jgi:hypothetical protein